MATASSQAVGVVEGTFIPERSILVAPDGQQYPARAVASVCRFFRKKPEQAALARYLVCWPRTTKQGVELTITDAPTDPDRQASLKREAGWFKVAGTVTNQRSRRNKVVVRVGRSQPAPPNRKRQSEFRPHLLFLSGRAAPAADFMNHHAVFGCQLVEQELVIRRIEERTRIRMEPMAAGGIQWPWPFHQNKAALLKLREFNTDQTTFIVKPPFQSTLAEALVRLSKLIDYRKTQQQDPAAAEVTDRLQIILRRLRTYTGRMGDFELHDLLEETGLHVVLNRIDLDAQPPAAAEPAAKPKAKAQRKAAPKPTPAAAVPEALAPIAAGLVEGWPDLLLRDIDGMTPARLRSGIAQLVASGWYDTLTTEEQELAKTSYQLKKALKLRP